MATKTSPTAGRTPPQSTTPDPAADQPQQPQPPTDLTSLIEQKRQLDAQIKAARAAQPTLSKLERVIASQRAQPTKWVPVALANRVRARVDAGQEPQDAIDAVLAQYRALLEAGSWKNADATEPPPAPATPPAE